MTHKEGRKRRLERERMRKKRREKGETGERERVQEGVGEGQIGRREGRYQDG